MQLNKILEYQELDMKIYGAEKKFQSSDGKRKELYIRHKFSEKSNLINSLSQETDELFATLTKYASKLNEIEDFEKNLNIDVSSIDDLSKLDSHNKSLVKYEELITSSERDLKRVTGRLGDIKSEIQKLHEAMLALDKEYRTIKAYNNAKWQEICQKLAPLIKKLDQLKNGIEPELIKKYYDLRKNRKMPAFVEYADGNCAGCGMQISIEVGPKLHKKGDYAECPECRRIVYLS